MESLFVVGGHPLQGTLKASGSKNGTLPLLAATLLVDDEVVLENVPDIYDVGTMIQMLRAVGAKCTFTGPGALKIDAGDIKTTQAPYDLVRRMRGSFYVAGALLGRLGEAHVPLPGGCVIGSRPVNLHVEGFQALGASVTEKYGVMEAQAAHLHGGRVYMDPRMRSVGATVNIMLAATLADGITIIENASREPEVVACEEFLKQCGANITNGGGARLVIEGVKRLTGCRFRSIADRMEVGTFLYATAIAGGDVTVHGTCAEHMSMVISKLQKAGMDVRVTPESVRLISRCGAAGHDAARPRAVDVSTAPYPGFPTDLQPAHGILASLADGTSVVEETIFDARFNYIDEIARMGADARVVGQVAIIRGVPKLMGAPVQATDIRAGAALVLAGLVAEGQTQIDGVHFLERGYESFAGKLRSLGAQIVHRSEAAGKGKLCLA